MLRHSRRKSRAGTLVWRTKTGVARLRREGSVPGMSGASDQRTSVARNRCPIGTTEPFAALRSLAQRVRSGAHNLADCIQDMFSQAQPA